MRRYITSEEAMLKDKVAALTAENERLREALREIVDDPNHTTGEAWKRAERIARAALSAPPAV